MVRAVYVARPTYSPNVYQQMVGRGLRGPLNGGSPECLIVNVEDNVDELRRGAGFPPSSITCGTHSAGDVT